MRKNLFPNIDWVGAIDWNVRDFHSYNTDRGATYNAYLIRDSQSALIDCVKGPFFDRYIKQVSELADPASIKYLVVNHGELDHTSGLPMAVKAFPNAALVTNKKCQNTLQRYFNTDGWNWHIVKTGDSLSLGNRTLQFIETPMVHWPDSMFTYVPEDELLFSMDAFGQHVASAARFDDEIDLDIVMDEAKTYYANIVVPHGKFVAKTLEAAAGLSIKMIAPSHGVIWRNHLDAILTAYKAWCGNRVRAKVGVFYDSMWESTGRIAEAITQGADVDGVATIMLHVRHSNLTRIATEFLDTAAFAFGSSTLNNLLMPAASSALVYMRGMNLPGKTGFAFGSYGWAAKGGADQVEAYMKEAGWTINRPVLKCSYLPDAAVLDEAEKAGRELARIALEAAAKA
ncbi:MAG: FprA family A-type flavoprotein [Planctomycetes bacterium]|nr:FprA family A-type flavoprotein [Planctomycetota bacterium]MCC8117052.1 FprA family A-type flavoprotein [Planctomycetota bacterium]MCD7896607.1 FprA family A-type flavoprotein [Planctomycetaceae bacterium]